MSTVPLGRGRTRIALAAAVAAAVAGATLVAVAAAGPAAASTTDAAFNSSTGALNVDYAGYLSKHDIVYNRPNTNPLHGLTVGNGRTGAMVWNAERADDAGVRRRPVAAVGVRGRQRSTSPPRPRWTPATRPSSSGCRSTTAR